MRSGRTRRHCHGRPMRMGSVAFVNALFVVLLIGALPAWATVTGPGSAHVLPGSAVGVTISTDGATMGVSGGHAGISVGQSGAAPTVRFTFTASTSASPGSYLYTFFDDVGGGSSFTLIVDAPTPTTVPPTTTTTATTRPPRTTTTTTEPATTTTTEQVPTVSIADGNATEGKAVWFNVTLSGAYSKVITVKYTTTDGTATTGDLDYVATSGVLTFIPGDTTETIAVPTGGDTRDEPNEDFTITLSAPSNATIRVGSATGTINDNDMTDAGVTLGDTTTTTTAIPAVISAPVDGERNVLRLVILLGGGLALVVLAVAGALTYSRRGGSPLRPTSGVAGIGNWWRTSGPLVLYKEWKSGRNVAKDLQKKIEERRRLNDE